MQQVKDNANKLALLEDLHRHSGWSIVEKEFNERIEAFSNIAEIESEQQLHSHKIVISVLNQLKSKI